MRAAEIFFLARVTRAAMVGSGTRKACAISAVDSPHTSRSVSATCASRASAGWQQVKISRSRSSGIMPPPSPAPAGSSGRCGAGSSGSTRSGSFRRRVVSRRSTSMARRRAAVVSQAPGLRGTPCRGPGFERGDVGVLHAFLGQVEVPGDARRRGEHEGPLATVRVRHGPATAPGAAGPPGPAGRPARPPDPAPGRGKQDGCPWWTGHMPSKTMIGRTSTPPKRAGQSLAISSA